MFFRYANFYYQFIQDFKQIIVLLTFILKIIINTILIELINTSESNITQLIFTGKDSTIKIVFINEHRTTKIISSDDDKVDVVDIIYSANLGFVKICF